jgi:malate dehydrogenase (oxaloacetate-decarboxylating)
VLGLGDVGGYAAIPVMEGKAVLFKEFAGIDAFPIIFEDYHTDFIEDVQNIAPIFGAICLEDIAAPKCFEVEKKLQGIGIPVMHDDQWGTAVVVLAALINASKVVGKEIGNMKILLCGAGAAGIAITRMLLNHVQAPADIIMCDSKGILYPGREHMNRYKHELSLKTNKSKKKGTLQDAIAGADAFIGVSKGGLLTEAMVRSMADEAIVFALANPLPEIMPARAKKAGARVVATGRSDFENQVNNVLAFPGIFRGLLDSCAQEINMEMKVAAADALAKHVKNPGPGRIIPDTLDRTAADAVANAVKFAAKMSGCARYVP